MSYSRYDIVKVPFPFTDKPANKFRPALVISDATVFNSVIDHSVMAMITSAKHSNWPHRYDYRGSYQCRVAGFIGNSS